MTPFRVAQVDHVELFVPDRWAAAAWYERTLGLSVVEEYRHWADDPRGPLMISPDGGRTKLALFTGEPPGGRPLVGFYLTAFRVGGADFARLLDHIKDNPVHDNDGTEVRSLAVRDHGSAWSVYFRDPWGHRLEVTTYDVEDARRACGP